ncbi:unnamed protein product [Oikopleura dioica]|uniref:chitinase n=1 Tax=Oikopleura dioica TaxID=34765 RepID=E4XY91_OIKDI|nr:unnamed protein product [Oikopleura dioica]
MKISALLLSTVKSASIFDDFCNGRTDGLYQYPWDCGKFYNCAGGRTFIQNCAPGTVFDNAIKTCNWPALTDQSGCDLGKIVRKIFYECC